MRRLVCLALALLAPVAASAQAIVPFSAPVVGPDPQLPSACVERGDERVCRITVPVADDVAGAVVVTRGGRETARWTAPIPGLAQEIRAFRAGRALVVAVLDAVSNGLGVQTWTLAVLPPGARRPAYSFTVEEFGEDGGSFAVRRGRLVVWATEWVDMADPAGRRVPGTYLVGRPFYVEAAGLVPATDLPIRARRLLDALERAHAEGVGEPVGWLADRRAETLRTDPALAGTARTTRGTVTAASVRMENGSPALAVTLRPASGSPVALLSQWQERAPWFSHVADAATGRLWPTDYRLVDVSAWLVGRRARLEVRDDAPGVLWRE